MTAETVGQPRGSDLALAARTRKPWQRRMKRTGGRSPQGRATATVMRQSVHASHALSTRPGNFSLLWLFSAAWLFLAFCVLAENDYSEQRQPSGGRTAAGAAQKWAARRPQGKNWSAGPRVCVCVCNDGFCRWMVEGGNLENLVLYGVRVNSPHLKTTRTVLFYWKVISWVVTACKEDGWLETHKRKPKNFFYIKKNGHTALFIFLAVFWPLTLMTLSLPHWTTVLTMKHLAVFSFYLPWVRLVFQAKIPPWRIHLIWDWGGITSIKTNQLHPRHKSLKA